MEREIDPHGPRGPRRGAGLATPPHAHDGKRTMTLEQFFAGHEDSWQVFEALRRAVAAVGSAQLELRVAKSQVAFCRRRPFAWAWMPGIYLHGTHPPLVLTVALRRRDPSPRWKEVVEPAPGRFTHHLELHSDAEIDSEVRAWLQEAWDLAG